MARATPLVRTAASATNKGRDTTLGVELTLGKDNMATLLCLSTRGTLIVSEVLSTTLERSLEKYHFLPAFYPFKAPTVMLVTKKSAQTLRGARGPRGSHL
jgi:hypothetical protein